MSVHTLSPLGEKEHFASSEDSPLLVHASLNDEESRYRRIVKQDASLFQCIANVSQNVLGTGGLAMPAVFANAGLSGGIFALLVTAAVASSTLGILGWLTFVTGARDMQQLVIIVLGKRASKISAVLVVGFMWSAGILLLQFIRSNLENVVQLSGVVEWYTDGRFLVTVSAIAILFPLSLIRNFTNLSYFSALGVGLVLFCFGFVIVEAIVFLSAGGIGVSIDYGFQFSIEFFLVFPTIIFSYMTHVAIVPMVAGKEEIGEREKLSF